MGGGEVMKDDNVGFVSEKLALKEDGVFTRRFDLMGRTGRISDATIIYDKDSQNYMSRYVVHFDGSDHWRIERAAIRSDILGEELAVRQAFNSAEKQLKAKGILRASGIAIPKERTLAQGAYF